MYTVPLKLFGNKDKISLKINLFFRSKKNAC